MSAPGESLSDQPSSRIGSQRLPLNFALGVTDLLRMRRSLLCLLLAAQTFAGGRIALAQAADGTQVALLSQLYSDFAWEATGGDDGETGRTFVDQPKAILLRYLEPQLATLLLRDRDCVRRSSEICRLDFAPLWDSQDPDAADVSFTQPDGVPNAVVAHIRDHRGAVVSITYRLQRTEAGWRIADIEYASGHSLRAILGGDRIATMIPNERQQGP